MVQGSRPIVSQFEDSERLYMRFQPRHFHGEELDPSAIRSEKQSVNRGLFSEPDDVLFRHIEDVKYLNEGVVFFFVGELPKTLSQADGPTYTTFVVHEPVALNYAHSEIWSDHVPPSGKSFRELSRSLKLTFRIELAKRINRQRIIIPPAEG
jgi:hypothetical protein